MMGDHPPPWGNRRMSLDRMRTAFFMGIAFVGALVWLALLIYILGVRAGRFA